MAEIVLILNHTILKFNDLNQFVNICANILRNQQHICFLDIA